MGNNYYVITSKIYFIYVFWGDDDRSLFSLVLMYIVSAVGSKVQIDADILFIAVAF